ncbi:MAG: phosphohydrolase [Verrucomicrobiota bacterium]|nr:phosphohydrolase [Verrucomicrobiota bacterium]
MKHIDKMLARLDDSGREEERDALELAIWFHDCVYEPLNNDNEARSAERFQWYLGPLVDQSLAETVHRLIMATDPKQSRSGASDEGLLVDIDLSILGSSPDEYAEYRTAIRKEYAVVPDVDFNAGRIRILKQLQSRQIYTTPGFTALENTAHANIQGELVLLEKANASMR